MSDKLQNNIDHNIILQIDIHCQSVLEKCQTVSDKLQNKFIILYLSAIELTCQTASDSVRQLQKHVRLKLFVQSKIFYVITLLFNIFFK